MGAVLLGDDVASGLALTKPRFCFKKTHDRATIVILILHWTPFDDRGDDSVMKET